MFWTGQFGDARSHLEKALKQYSPERSHIHIATFTQDPAVVCLMRPALVLWTLGEAELAARREEESLALGRQVSHPFSQAYALAWNAVLQASRRDARATRVVMLSSEPPPSMRCAASDTVGKPWERRSTRLANRPDGDDRQHGLGQS
jgi:hypothetical protein